MAGLTELNLEEGSHVGLPGALLIEGERAWLDPPAEQLPDAPGPAAIPVIVPSERAALLDRYAGHWVYAMGYWRNGTLEATGIKEHDNVHQDPQPWPLDR
jgi:hypothetical protein